MSPNRVRVRQDELRSVVLPRLIGRVFHVTTRAGYAGISRDGLIKSNQDAVLPFSYPQSEASYFRKRGCVCLFDLRSATADQIDEALQKFYFLDPSSEDKPPVFLFLNHSCYERLIPWSVSFPDEGYRAMVIPYVEAGYSGDIPLSLIDSVLSLQITRRQSQLSRWRRTFRKGGELWKT